VNKFEKIKEILLENLGCEEEDIKLESKLIDDLGADSLDIVELSLALEESFDITVKDEDFEKLQTVGAIIEYLESN